MAASPIIPLADPHHVEAEARPVFDSLVESIGFVPNYWRLLAQTPQLVGPIEHLHRVVMGDGAVPNRYKVLAMLRTCELNRAVYCRAVARGLAEDMPWSDEQKQAVASRDGSLALFEPKEQLVLQLATQMTLDIRADEPTISAVQELFGTEGAVELMALIALNNFHNRMSFTAALPVDDVR